MKKASVLLKPCEAAKLLNVSEKTLWNHTAPRGKCIPSVQLGKAVRYSRVALEAWIAEQSTAPIGEACGLAPGWCRIDFDMKQGFPFELEFRGRAESLARGEGK